MPQDLPRCAPGFPRVPHVLFKTAPKRETVQKAMAFYVAQSAHGPLRTPHGSPKNPPSPLPGPPRTHHGSPKIPREPPKHSQEPPWRSSKDPCPGISKDPCKAPSGFPQDHQGPPRPLPGDCVPFSNSKPAAILTTYVLTNGVGIWHVSIPYISQFLIT